MLEIIKNKSYITYAGSIVIGRGLEFFVFYYAAFVFSKSDFGELEFFRKFIEIFSIGVSFGFPALLMSYTRGVENKKYFFALSFISIIFLSIILFGISYFFEKYIFIIPLFFYSLFFTGGIIQSYILVIKGGIMASYYKIIISFIFYLTLFILIYFYKIKAYSLIYTTYLLILPLLIITTYYIYKLNLNFRTLYKYFTLFKKLLFASFTMVLSDFSNLLFIYTDIFIIKLLSDSVNSELADFSFAINIAALILIISMTLIQVNIEKLKNNSNNYLIKINRQIILLSILASSVLIVIYWFVIKYIYTDYINTFFLFLIILLAKNFQSFSNLFGTQILILKSYKINLILNLFYMILNIVLCLFFYKLMGLVGIALSSLFCLMGRFVMLFIISKKLIFKLKIKKNI